LKEELTLVWVELGRNIPRYLKRNIKLHRRLYPNSNLVLVTDRQYEDSNLSEVFDVNELTKSSLHQNFVEINKVWNSHQMSFWINTTKRLFVLHDHILTSGLSSIIHLESDVILLDYDSAKKVCEIATATNQIAYPMYDDSFGSAGIIFIPNHRALEGCLNFIINHWETEGETDMSLLGKYRSHSFTLYNGINDEFGNQPSGSQVVWDGGRLGQYFLGTDARNSRFPLSRRYKGGLLNPSEVAKLERIRFNFEMVKRNPQTGGRKILASIHVHNKLIPRTKAALSIQLRMSIGLSNYLKYINLYRLDSVVLAERLISFVKRRFKGDKREVNLR